MLQMGAFELHTKYITQLFYSIPSGFVNIPLLGHNPTQFIGCIMYIIIQLLHMWKCMPYTGVLLSVLKNTLTSSGKYFRVDMFPPFLLVHSRNLSAEILFSLCYNSIMAL